MKDPTRKTDARGSQSPSTQLTSGPPVRARYGTGGALEPSRIAKEALLGRTEGALRAAGFDVKDYQFANFEDEYAGTTPKKGLPKDFDARRASKHVARAVAFEKPPKEGPLSDVVQPRKRRKVAGRRARLP
jgi:hypothetical protein